MMIYKHIEKLSALFYYRMIKQGQDKHNKND